MKKRMGNDISVLSQESIKYATKSEIETEGFSGSEVSEPDLFGENDWRLKEFSQPSAEIRIGTLFSGIGAIEHALHRLRLNHSIIFAGDIDQYVKESFLANYEITPI